MLNVVVDGEEVLDETYPPAGLRNEGKSSTVDTLWLGSGEYLVTIEMMDDGETFEVVFDGPVTLEGERILTLLWDRRLRGVRGGFLLIRRTRLTWDG